MVMKIWSALAERLAGLLTRLGLCSPGKVMYGAYRVLVGAE